MGVKLSIVIVNYNVKHFLEQCLHSVRKATTGIASEVFVVDNNSVDGSLAMLKEKFPGVIVIANKQNVGFSRANNQAISISTGEYVLLLNPDTVVEDHTFRECLRFMDAHPDAGGLGVMMVDGKGKFLPESKRGFPSPATSFYKTFGLSRLFPKSKIFGKYHLGYLNKNEIHEVDVLAGAFMMLRKKVLDITGLLDESFFMYGEDIDLSYRIIKAGYKNYYYPKTRIIHYKGESTKKGSLNYVFVFYNAMVIFARKHFSKQNAWVYISLINLAIYFRATLSIVNRFLKKALLPFSDILLLYTGIYLFKGYWEQKVIFTQGGHYPPEFMYIALPAYIFIWLISVYFSGGYDQPVRLAKMLQGIIIGTVIILVFYALLPESWRFSRALILFGASWGIISMMGIRLLLAKMKISGFTLGIPGNNRFVIVGSKEEADRVSDLLHKTRLNPGFIGYVGRNDSTAGKGPFIGNLGQLSDIITIFNIDEIIFCSKDIPHQEIIDNMSELQDKQVKFKIAPEDSLSIIGSNSINTSGDIYIIDINSIDRPQNRRSKKLFDIISCLALIAISPVLLLVIKKPFHFLANIFMVIFGKKSLVGYYQSKTVSTVKLPHIKPGILNPGDVFKNRPIADETYDKLNLIYARDYKTETDFNILIRGILNLGRY